MRALFLGYSSSGAYVILEIRLKRDKQLRKSLNKGSVKHWGGCIVSHTFVDPICIFILQCEELP